MLKRHVLRLQLTVELAVVKFREFGEHPYHRAIPSQACVEIHLKV